MMRTNYLLFNIFILVFTLSFFPQSLASDLADVKVDAPRELQKLLSLQDSDNDHKITLDDLFHPSRKSREASFILQSAQGKKFSVSGIYYLSNLLQELKLASENNHNRISGGKIYENPVERISRSIKERYWDGLVRKIDKSHLAQVLGDSKVDTGGRHYLYLPHDDKEGLKYFTQAATENPNLKMEVIKLPVDITPDYVKNIEGKHGLLALGLQKDSEGKVEGVPYVVPGGRFNEMYGWDSYFEALGLIVDDKSDLAQAMVDNFIYQINHYGKILNANRTYYLTRSQPPFLTSMIKAVYEVLPKNAASREWLKKGLRAALKEYYSVWMAEPRLTATGLSRYFGNGVGIPPEVEPGHFDFILQQRAQIKKMPLEKFTKAFQQGEIQDTALDEFLLHDRSVRESGHDTTYRWSMDGKDQAANFVTVDLNALLYKYELDFAQLIKEEFGGNFDGHHSGDFEKLAFKRKKLIRKYLWDEKKELFYDYNFILNKPSSYLSATTFYPLWSYDPARPSTRILKEKETQNFVTKALSKLEQAGGISATAKDSQEQLLLKPNLRQWEYPFGWAPHQMLVWQGLKNFGYHDEAERLIYRWLYMITLNAMNYNGTIPEKYDVVTKSHDVFAEYGNVGTEFDYITREGFGWMNASYQVGLHQLSLPLKKKLMELVPPDWINFEK
jgi:alpha,alpha-trehalase